MNSKIINPSQYKKITKNTAEKRKEKINKKISSGKYEEINVNNNSKRKEREKEASKRLVIGLVLVCIMILLSIVSSSVFEIDKNEYISVISKIPKFENTLNRNFILKIGISNLNLSKNVIINELNFNTYSHILTYDKDYNITYDLAEDIKKEDNKTYIIKMKAEDLNTVVKENIESLKKNKDSLYYNAFNNIDSVSLIDKYSLKIKLKHTNVFFMYYLDFDLNILKSDANYKAIVNTTDKKVTYNKSNENVELINGIEVSNYLSGVELVEKFKNNEISMFLTNNEDDIKSLNRYDYNEKKYRDGESYFMLGNPNSNLFKQEEIRKILAYSIDRNEIAKKVSTSFTEVIDIPFIYSDVKYRYDPYATANLLSSNSWIEKDGIYTKELDSKTKLKLKLKIIVNSDDSIKNVIANSIKESLEKNSIKVEVVKLTSEKLNEALKNGDYDIVISKINLTKNPDISSIFDYLKINDNLNTVINDMYSADVTTLQSAIKKLEETISNEIACIGIISKNVSAIYQKNIVGFDEISYMNIFKNIDKIGIENKRD